MVETVSHRLYFLLIQPFDFYFVILKDDHFACGDLRSFPEFHFAIAKDQASGDHFLGFAT